MPPITVTHYEPDDNGGWFVEFHDAANLDGDPLDGFIHITVEKANEFARLLKHLKVPEQANHRVKLAQSLGTLARDRGGRPEVPVGVVPYAVRDFVEFYDGHVADCIDRCRLNVAGHAPHTVLEDARRGVGPPPDFQRRRDTAVKEFAQRRIKEQQDA